MELFAEERLELILANGFAEICRRLEINSKITPADFIPDIEKLTAAANKPPEQQTTNDFVRALIRSGAPVVFKEHE